MKSRVDDRLRTEAEHFRFVFTCERCAHFEPNSGACVNGYPNLAHRRGLDVADALEFCKEFELA